MTNQIGMDHLIKAIDNRMATVQSNTKVLRHLRPMSYQAKWKAREYLVWILFYSVPCLTGLLKNKYLLHLSLLSAAMNLLLQRSVSDSDMKQADTYLKLYTVYYQKYFGEKRMVYNFHLLSHLVKSVRDFGPLWGFSAFPYEAQNHYLLLMAKNHASVAMEIAQKFAKYQLLPILVSTSKLAPSTLNFIDSLMKHKMLRKCARSGKCVLVGKACELNYNLNLCPSLPEINLTNCRCYRRIIYQRNSYCTVSYSRNKEINDSGALLLSGQYVVIHNFILLADKSVIVDVEVLNLVGQPILQGEHIKLRHVKGVECYGLRKCVGIDMIYEPIFVLNSGGSMFVSRLPYGCTVE